MPSWSVKLGMVMRAKAVSARRGTAPSGGCVVVCPMVAPTASRRDRESPCQPRASPTIFQAQGRISAASASFSASPARNGHSPQSSTVAQPLLSA